MKPYQIYFAVFFTVAPAASPSFAQQPLRTPQTPSADFCAGSFAYLVLAPSIEQAPYAIRADATGPLHHFSPQTSPTNSPLRKRLHLAPTDVRKARED
jgi:hypothetical protein